MLCTKHSPSSARFYRMLITCAVTTSAPEVRPMKIVNRKLLDEFRKPGYCEVCNFYIVKLASRIT